MQEFNKLIEVVDLAQIAKENFKQAYVSALVLSHDGKILLQQRDIKDNISHPGCISTFGGKIESGEEPIQALIREMDEELGAQVNPKDVVILGTITEAISNYTELLYLYFWQDKLNTITGCYEGSPLYFDNIASIKTRPKVMDYVLWILHECQKRQLLRF